jgi:hypothetical protein
VNENLRVRIRGWVRPATPVPAHEAEPAPAANPSPHERR